MAPFEFSKGIEILIPILIGFGFGFSLENGGFGDSRRLAAQFYFHEMRVLKVMFTAIIVAMVLTFWAASLGFLDFEKVYVPVTHLWPGILGGLLLGAGFIVGGYCPGTSFVAAATLKIDGIVFIGGLVAGMLVFNETAEGFWTYYQTSGYMGRFMLSDLVGLPTGVIVFGVIVMAVVAFTVASYAEGLFAWLRPKDMEPVVESKSEEVSA